MMSKRIGYSCWGFLGNGIVDTPDGGRSHRPTLIRGLIRRGYKVIMLQLDRDRFEARETVDLGQTYGSGFPDIDVLFLEWRWPIPGRNDNPAIPGYTPDLARQRELVRYYASRVPIVVWDKDQQLAHSPVDDRLALVKANTYVLEPSLYLSPPDRARALFPVEPGNLCVPPERGRRTIELIYIGNQYDRDRVYDQYIVSAAKYIPVHVYGKWPRYATVPGLTHHGRIGLSRVVELYQQSVATVLLAPDRYMKTGQFTQRIFESVIGGCIPLVPADYRGSDILLPPFAHANTGCGVVKRVREIQAMSFEEWQELVHEQMSLLEPFHVDHTLDAVESAINCQTPQFKDMSPLGDKI